MTTRLPLLYSTTHTQHAPPTEFSQGALIPCSDTPERIETIRQALQQANLVQEYPTRQPEDCLAALQSIHDPRLLHHLAQRSAATPEGHYCYPERFDFRPAARTRYPDGAFAFDIFSPIGHGTWPAALAAAGLALQGADLLRSGWRAAYALCRPPGHHAEWGKIGGYCYLNNAVLAAHRLRSLGRVALLDLDYHHGNGSQQMLRTCPEIAMASLHAAPPQVYPHTSGFASKNARNTRFFNHPLPDDCDGQAYHAALQRALSALCRFRPATLVVSLGFDTAQADPTGGFCLHPADYAAFGTALAKQGLPTLFVQEGGYGPAIGDCATAFVGGFLG